MARSHIASILLVCTATAIPAAARQAAARTPAYAYDVVSIKPHVKGDGNRLVNANADHYHATNISLSSLIEYAYDIKVSELVSGIPKMLDDQTFDVDAKLDAETSAALKALPQEQRFSQQRLLMRAVLADRFKLKIHMESKEIAEYALVPAKGGFKLKPADPGNGYSNGIKGPDGTSRPGSVYFSYGRVTTQACTLATLATVLQNQVHRLVVDRTGIPGLFDVDLHFRPDDLASNAQDGASDASPTIYTALQEQLGLKLESIKAPADAVVVDHVELPSEN